MKKSLLTLLVFFSTAMLLVICCSPVLANPPAEFLDDDDFYDTSPPVPDPFEPVNRAIHAFNDAVLNYAGRPLYKAYAFVTPRFVRSGISNAFHNALFPVRFVNNLLQGKGLAAGVEMSRFVLNSVAGLGGFIDVASSHKTIVPVDDEDFGQTLGVWGASEGIYLVLPFLGPSTLRDTFGIIGDHFTDPLTYVKPAKLSFGLQTARTFNDLDDTLDRYDDITRSAVEPYNAFRDAYIQYRKAKVTK